MEKAQQKAAAREAERQRLAAELQQLQFQESCDPLRAAQSQQRLLTLVEEQKRQVGTLYIRSQSSLFLLSLVEEQKRPVGSFYLAPKVVSSSLSNLCFKVRDRCYFCKHSSS